MIYEDKDLTFEVPDDWVVEDEDGIRSIFNEDGEGAITVSIYRIEKLEENIEKKIKDMAVECITNNNIKIEKKVEVIAFNEQEAVVYARGKAPDGWFVKLWVVASFPTVIVITYWSEEKTKELDIVDKIVESFKFKEE